MAGPPPIPTWKQRLGACFRFRHRLMHVFGAPAAVGALTAIAAGSALNPDVGFSLGAMAAGIGSLIVGYWVTAGFDKGLVKALQAEHVARETATEASEIQRVVDEAEPQLRPFLQRILQYYESIEGQFTDGIDDQVEAILQNSRPDLKALRDRAISMAKLFRKLREIILQSDARMLDNEVRRMERDLSQMPDGPVKAAMQAAKDSTERTLGQWRAAVDKQAQVENVLRVIESNLQEFKLAMELRKADQAMGTAAAGTEISELQARLAATGQACDELVGRTAESPRRARRRA